MDKLEEIVKDVEFDNNIRLILQLLENVKEGLPLMPAKSLGSIADSITPEDMAILVTWFMNHGKELIQDYIKAKNGCIIWRSMAIKSERELQRLNPGQGTFLLPEDLDGAETLDE